MTTQPQSARNAALKDPLTFLSAMVSRFASSSGYETSEVLRSLCGSLRNRNFLRALDIADSITQQQYSNAREHFVLNQAAALVRKFPLPFPGVDPESAAMKKFHAAEHRCKRLNQKMVAYNKRPLLDRPYRTILRDARTWIEKVIGEKPDILAILDEADFTAGANIGVGGNATSQSDKLRVLIQTGLSVTPSARGYFKALLWRNIHYRELLLVQKNGVYCHDISCFNENFDKLVKNVDYNEIFMVQKETKCHRTAAKEAAGNSAIQKGADKHLKKKLKKFGLDLQMQEPNQVLAFAGSLDDGVGIVTIDLTSASDSKAVLVVRELIPPQWFSFLNAIRSPSYKEGNSIKRYEKFVSMGNGFCFPLETLIFASIVVACNKVTGSTIFRVYGDDIICEQQVALLVIEVLRFLGFKTNVKKTFIHGPFRESCGADWFSGVNVRPFMFDFVPQNKRDFIKVWNGLHRNDEFDEELKGLREFVWNYVHDLPLVPREYINLDDYAYQACAVPIDVFMGSKHASWDAGLQRWRWKEYCEVGVKSPHSYTPTIQWAALLRGSLPSDDFTPEHTLRYQTQTRLVTKP